MRIRVYLFILLMSVFNPVWGQLEIVDSLQREVKVLECYADSCYNCGDISSAQTIYAKIFDTWNKYGIRNENYAKTLFNLSRCLNKKGDYLESIKLGKEALEIQKEIFGEQHSDYVASLNNLANSYAELGEYTESIKRGNDAMKIAKQLSGTESLDYAMSLNVLAWSYSCIGNNVEAVRLASKALEIRKNILGSEHPDYATSLSNYALYKSIIGNYSEAITLELEAKKIRENTIGRYHKDYAISLDNLGSYYSYIGNYTEALKLSSEALNIREKVLGRMHDEYAISLHSVATINAYIGNYTEAVRLESEAIDIIKKRKENSIFYIGFANVLCTFKNVMGDYEESLRLSEDIVKTIEEVWGRDIKYMATTLGNMAESYLKLGQHDLALKYASEAVEIRKKTQGENHPDYAYELYSLSRWYSAIGNYDKAIKLENKALRIYKKKLGEKSIDYRLVLTYLAKNHFALADYSIASQEIVRVAVLESNHLISNFANLSSFRRRHLWNVEKTFYLTDIPQFAFRVQNSCLNSTLYNYSALLAKGLLLNTEIEMKKLIDESESIELSSIYKTLLSNHEIYEKQCNIPKENRDIDIDSLSQVIQNMEDELTKRVQAYGDYMRNLKVTWSDIQQVLGDRDIAIEFLDFPVNEDSVMYIALTLKKEYDSPRMIPLFELHQLKNINKNAYYRTSLLTRLVWEPLEKELADVENIYFSPSGELHKIGIEYLQLKGGKIIGEQYTMHRLSSTRQLVIGRKESSTKQAVLYGGIDYDALMSSTSSTTDTENSVMTSIRNVPVDSLSVRGTREYLEGTKIEANNISENLKKHKWDCIYYTGAEGTEKSFKEMSGNSPSLLHIATHGFYMTEEDAKREQEVALLESKERGIKRTSAVKEDKPMERSGLLFSGCNHVLNHEDVSTSENDGILTAQEIASLDLRGLDLVVLSACETGLGDISSGEGVFGLQRGFKKAGANTIIMSLWKVSDKATEMLMTTFYNYYLNGMSKYEAFSTAREELRKTCPPRQNKPDWAAFIMLDAIN